MKYPPMVDTKGRLEDDLCPTGRNDEPDPLEIFLLLSFGAGYQPERRRSVREAFFGKVGCLMPDDTLSGELCYLEDTGRRATWPLTGYARDTHTTLNLESV